MITHWHMSKFYLIILAACTGTCRSQSSIEAAVAAAEDGAALSCLQRQVTGVEKLQPRKAEKDSANRHGQRPFTEKQRRPFTEKQAEERSSTSKHRSSQDPQSTGIGDYESEAGLSSCGPPGNSAFFASLIQNDFDTNFVAIDLTEGFRDQDTLTVLITAMSTKGSYTDEYGFDMTRAMPLEDSENTLLELRLSADRTRVEIYKPAMTERTSDDQTRLALKDGLGDGFLDSHARLECGGPEDPDGSRIVISAEPLFLAGFYVASAFSDSLSYRVERAASFQNNFDLSAEYIMGGGYPPMHVGYSVILLPKTPMAPRPSDDRLLYFSSDYIDLGYSRANNTERPSSHVDKFRSMIWRYNLATLKDGVIRIHVDPSVPSRWRPWFREGIEGWNVAFSDIGLPNAVRGVLPEDADWPADYDIADARFSTISWDLSEEVVSMGIAKVDPRSGEIIKSDIIMADGWVKAWLQDLELMPEFALWSSRDSEAFLQTSQGSLQETSRASSGLKQRHRAALRVEHRRHRKGTTLRLDDKRINITAQEALLGSGLKNIVMHETGHILGLRHNFKGSLGASLSCLQDMACTGKHGLGASVMDYVPMNIPENGGLDEVHVFSPVVGAYDRLAIAYGYTVEREASWPAVPAELQSVLESATFETCYDEDADAEVGEDPTCTPYDLSDDPVAYFEQELDRHAKAHRHLLQMSVGPGDPYRLYGRAFSTLMDKTSRISEKASRYLGGIKELYLHRSQDGSMPVEQMSRQPIALDTQRRALALLLRTLRPSESGLVPPDEHLPFLVSGHSDSVSSVDHVRTLQTMTHSVLDQILSSDRILQVYRQERLVSTSNASLTVNELLNSLVGSILEPGLERSESLDASEMDLQMYLITKLKDLYLYGAKAPNASSDIDDSSFGSDSTEAEALPAMVNSQVLHSLRQALLLTQRATARLPDAPSSYRPMWQQCATEGQDCACQGLVRHGSSAGQQDGSVFSSARAVTDSIVCNATSFPAGPAPKDNAKHAELLQAPLPVLDRHQLMLTQLARPAHVQAKKSWCECLTSDTLEGSEMMRAHVTLLGRELSHVFCDDALHCKSPRVPALVSGAALTERSAAVGTSSGALAVAMTCVCFIISSALFRI
eukprot:CAMPEP_0197656850 /NCGR_PEP_ID=MMETSP1338-20131121/43655_1 /TAXON_ID=43686 ORGANISM="Pelagodinium beii, Strain RCC1491" /NCGR_SAMPLE_ID=MMETSP1338 /ASSEMBLY_ACC=CAM_ASM_000754 /LENGTH=1122 /DNA_ID=CAMNT_0043233059 /DNA_START=69 /DNA_END=3437 /DNA_ORIENTATION=+